MYQLTELAKSKLKGNYKVLGRFMSFFNRSELTLKRMIESGDQKLFTPYCLQMISEETGLKVEEIVTPLQRVPVQS